MTYLKSAVVDLGLPDFINHLIPIVEASMQTPVSNTLTSGTVTTGTISPGLIYVGNTFQDPVEALIPVNRQSGTSVGVIGQLHFFLTTFSRTRWAVPSSQIASIPGDRCSTDDHAQERSYSRSRGSPLRHADLCADACLS